MRRPESETGETFCCCIPSSAMSVLKAMCFPSLTMPVLKAVLKKWAYTVVMIPLMVAAVTVAAMLSTVNSEYNARLLAIYASFIYIVAACFFGASCICCCSYILPKQCRHPPSYFVKLYGLVDVDYTTEI